VNDKIKEVKKDLAADTKIDPERLRQAVMDDLIQEQLMTWLEENSTLSETSSKAADAEPKPTKTKASSKAKSKADADA
jgi:trigger factor